MRAICARTTKQTHIQYIFEIIQKHYTHQKLRNIIINFQHRPPRSRFMANTLRANFEANQPENNTNNSNKSDSSTMTSGSESNKHLNNTKYAYFVGDYQKNSEFDSNTRNK